MVSLPGGCTCTKHLSLLSDPAYSQAVSTTVSLTHIHTLKFSISRCLSTSSLNLAVRKRENLTE